MMATRYFRAQAQRMFSSSGQIINNKRNAILQNMAKLIVLKEHFHFYKLKIMLHSTV